MTQSQVARQIKLEKETISRIESGKISVNLERLQEFAEVFNCSIIDLIYGDRNKDNINMHIEYMLDSLSHAEREAIVQLVRNTINIFKSKNLY